MSTTSAVFNPDVFKIPKTYDQHVFKKPVLPGFFKRCPLTLPITMSSSSDSDKEVVKKTKSRKEDDKKNKKRPTRNATQKSIIEIDSESSLSDVSSDEDEPSTSGRKRKATGKSTLSSKKRRSGKSENGDKGGDDVDDGLHLTEEEQRKLESMTEKEREQEIFYRMEQLESQKIRQQIEKRLREQNGMETQDKSKKRKQEKKKETSSSSSSDSEKSAVNKSVSPVQESSGAPKEGGDSGEEANALIHPSEIHRKKKQKSAMEDLVKQRKEREAKKASLAVDHVFGKGRASSTSSSSSSGSTRSSSQTSSSTRSTTRYPKATEDSVNKRPVESRAELLQARISRFKMARFVHTPFFSKTVVDCFVRIGIGHMPNKQGNNNYRIAQVVEVVETGKVYDVENVRTNKGLRLRYGSDERVYRLEFISNTEFTESEFDEWMATMKDSNCTLPTLAEISRKKSDIHKAVNHNFTSEEVDEMLKEKSRFQKTPKNFAMTKGNLMKQLEFAKQNSEHAEVQRLQNEIMQIDQKADMLDKKRSGDISAICWINKRNRAMMKEQFLGKEVKVDLTMEDDPFTRKSGRMKVVSGRDKTSKLPTTAADTAAELPATTTGQLPAVAAQAMGDSKSSSDLFSLHNMRIDIDLDLDKLKNNTNLPPAEDSSRTVSYAVTKGRPLSLEDYKKRKAAAAAIQP